MTALERGAIVELTGNGWNAFGVVGLQAGTRHKITDFWYDDTPVIQDTSGEEWAVHLHSPEEPAPFWGATLVPAPTETTD